jgi:hypothetical protein
VRLDRAVADSNRSNLFPNHQVRRLTYSRSDHCPILVNLDLSGILKSLSPGRRYECYWERKAALVEEVASAWSMHKRQTDLGDVASNLDSLHTWSRCTIGCIAKQLNRKKNVLEKIEA